MKREEIASISIIKIICVSIILVLISGIGVMAVSTNLNDVKIVLQNGYELTALTSKTKVSEILEENNIILAEDEKVIPSEDEEITSENIIRILKKTEQEVQIAKIAEEGVQTSVEDLLNNYAPITEKIVKEQQIIPYETITKESGSGSETTNKVVQAGQEGIKELTYKVKYQKDVEIEKILLSEEIIKEPVNKIVQVNKVTSRASSTIRTSDSGETAEQTGDAITCKITAYCSCSKCCGKSNGITAAGTVATAGRTVAASSKYPIGTKLNIGGHIYTVEDRGGAITGNKIDIFVSSHSEALAWGVRYLPVSVVE